MVAASAPGRPSIDNMCVAWLGRPSMSQLSATKPGPGQGPRQKLRTDILHAETLATLPSHLFASSPINARRPSGDLVNSTTSTVGC